MSLAAMGGGMLSIASAADIAIVNPGFEDITGQAVVEEFTFGTPVGWARHDPNAITGLGACPWVRCDQTEWTFQRSGARKNTG